MSRPLPSPKTWADDVPDRRAAQRLWAAVVLAPRVEVCEALLASVSVPSHRLDSAWRRSLSLTGDVVLDDALVLRAIAHGPLPGKEVAR